MCGIFGIIAGPNSQLTPTASRQLIDVLFKLSESRGKESSGIAFKNVSARRITVLKDGIAATRLIRSQSYAEFCDTSFSSDDSPFLPYGVMAHSRLVTNGTLETNANNQPVIGNGLVMIHNGIITNVKELSERYSGKIERRAEVDTEVLGGVIRVHLDNGESLPQAVINAFGQIEGAASIAFFRTDSHECGLATNTGSLYYAKSTSQQVLVFASEEYILNTVIANDTFTKLFPDAEVTWLEPFSGLHVEMSSFDVNVFRFSQSPSAVSPHPSNGRDVIVDFSRSDPIRSAPILRRTGEEAILDYPVEAVSSLRRCSRCILPETFPFIRFDSNGVCNYCHHHASLVPKQERKTELLEVLKPFRSALRQNCIVAYSGGRDSSYGLHYIVHELGMRPLTFTYDWGMVTDLARRNIARMTGKLGVENILVSADIGKKRRNIRRNVSAWLKRPRLGMLPLLMAGDKHFFIHVNRVRKQTGIRCDIWMENKLENTHFKTGFAGLRPDFERKRIDKLSPTSKFKLLAYYGKEFLLNPAYLNRSLKDTLGSFYAYYVEPREVYLLLYDYIRWDESTIERTLIDEYNWETSTDTPSTWRIGDGTAPFYNYVYFTIAGFSEVDTFRSNQIREGMLSRQEALDRAMEENRPRYESIRWYLDTIGLEFEAVIRRVNSISRLYAESSSAR
jgi:hypothetical protein